MLAPLPAAAAGSETAADDDGGLAGSTSSSSAGKVIARTFEYAVQTPVMPSQLSIAVGQFEVLPYGELLAAAGIAAAALPPGAPIINVFALKDATGPAAAGVAAADGSQQVAASQQPGSNGSNSSDGNSKAAGAAAGTNGNTAATGNGTSHVLSQERLRLLADTLKPLGVLLQACGKVLNSSLPWGHLHVAVLPEGLMMQPWQVRACKRRFGLG
jgi:hypothetical protein